MRLQRWKGDIVAMKRPEGLSCHQCEHWYWYAGQCDISGIISNPIHNNCNRFKIKTTQEKGFEYYDSLPTPEQLEIFCKAANEKIAISKLQIATLNT